MNKNGLSNQNYEAYAVFCENLNYYRRRAGMTQKDVAESVGISTRHYQSLESQNQNNGCTFEVLFNIARTFGIPVYKLFKPLDEPTQ